MDRAILVPDAKLQVIATTALDAHELRARGAEDAIGIFDVRSIPRIAGPAGLPVTADSRPGSSGWIGRGNGEPAPVDRLRLHKMATMQIAEQLRRMDLDVQAMPPITGADLLVNGRVRIAVRAALRAARQHRVRVGGRLYEYQRHIWQFNFHRHGRVGRRYCDYFICLPLASDNAPNVHEALIIPWTARRGMTLHIAREPYEGWYARYRDAWEQLRRRCDAAGRAGQRWSRHAGAFIAPPARGVQGRMTPLTRDDLYSQRSDGNLPRTESAWIAAK